MYKKFKNVKGMSIMTKAELKTIQAGDLLDCEEGEVPVDGACVPVELVAVGDGRLPGGTMDNCQTS